MEIRSYIIIIRQKCEDEIVILSVSRRTDIPAFYSDWFFNRIREGYVLVRNPMNYRQVSKVLLTPELIDCIVFWTKDPGAIIDKLDLLSGFKYYFQISLNGYPDFIERNLRQTDKLVESFKQLSCQIGKDRTNWRYDPIWQESCLNDSTSLSV